MKFAVSGGCNCRLLIFKGGLVDFEDILKAIKSSGKKYEYRRKNL